VLVRKMLYTCGVDARAFSNRGVVAPPDRCSREALRRVGDPPARLSHALARTLKPVLPLIP